MHRKSIRIKSNRDIASAKRFINTLSFNQSYSKLTLKFDYNNKQYISESNLRLRNKLSVTCLSATGALSILSFSPDHKISNSILLLLLSAYIGFKMWHSQGTKHNQSLYCGALKKHCKLLRSLQSQLLMLDFSHPLDTFQHQYKHDHHTQSMYKIERRLLIKNIKSICDSRKQHHLSQSNPNQIRFSKSSHRLTLSVQRWILTCKQIDRGAILDDMEVPDKYTCLILKTIPEIPVLLDSRLYDLSAITQHLSLHRFDPVTKDPATLSQLQPAREFFEKIIAYTKSLSKKNNINNHIRSHHI